MLIFNAKEFFNYLRREHNLSAEKISKISGVNYAQLSSLINSGRVTNRFVDVIDAIGYDLEVVPKPKKPSSDDEFWIKLFVEEKRKFVDTFDDAARESTFKIDDLYTDEYKLAKKHVDEIRQRRVVLDELDARREDKFKLIQRIDFVNKQREAKREESNA